MSESAATSFHEDLVALLALLEAAVARGVSIADLRHRQGRELGKANRENLSAIATCLGELKATLEELVEPPNPDDRVELQRELERFNRMGG